jgi:hypothetical protein
MTSRPSYRVVMSSWVREKLCDWTGFLETFFIEAIFQQRQDWKAKIARAILSGFSKVYVRIF